MSKGREDLLSTAEAAAFLGVHKESLRYWKDKGFLVPHYTESAGRKGEYYDPVEVAAFKEAQELALKPKEQLLLLAQANANARMAQRRIDALEALLGVASTQLSTRPTDIRNLYEEAQIDSKKVINGIEKVNYWADKLFGVNNVYLELVAEVIHTEEPWTPFTEVARILQLYQDWEGTRVDIETRMAYTKLRTACKALNAAVFMYCIRSMGLRRAIAQFPRDFGDEHISVMLRATDY